MSRAPALVLLAATTVALTTGSAASHAAASKRVGTIAFIRLANDTVFGGHLFVIRPDGGGVRRLTPPSTKVYSYAWSPDATLIAYNDSRGSLWLVRPDGQGRRLLVPASRMSTQELSWSPDGKAIAVLATDPNVNPPRRIHERSIYVIPVDGGEARHLPVGDAASVAWSPHGAEIALNRLRAGISGIWGVHPDGSDLRQISVGGLGKWSADGTQLAFGVALPRRNGFTDLDRYRAFGVVNADATGFHVVTRHAYNEYGLAWSPQGRRILYGRADRKGIYVIDADGRNNRRVTRDSPPEADWGALAWSPTGGSIVYTTGSTDNTDLYVIGADGRGKVQLTNTPEIDIDPSWVAR